MKVRDRLASACSWLARACCHCACATAVAGLAAPGAVSRGDGVGLRRGEATPGSAADWTRIAAPASTVPAPFLTSSLIALGLLLREGQCGLRLRGLFLGLVDAGLLRGDLRVDIGDVGLAPDRPALWPDRPAPGKSRSSSRTSTAPASTSWLSVTGTSTMAAPTWALICTVRASMKASSVDFVAAGVEPPEHDTDDRRR